MKRFLPLNITLATLLILFAAVACRQGTTGDAPSGAGAPAKQDSTFTPPVTNEPSSLVPEGAAPVTDLDQYRKSQPSFQTGNVEQIKALFPDQGTGFSAMTEPQVEIEWKGTQRPFPFALRDYKDAQGQRINVRVEDYSTNPGKIYNHVTPDYKPIRFTDGQLFDLNEPGKYRGFAMILPVGTTQVKLVVDNRFVVTIQDYKNGNMKVANGVIAGFDFEALKAMGQ